MTHFILAHAGHSDWRVALDRCWSRIRPQLGAPSVATPTLGWCYLSDYYASAADEVLEALHERLPGARWVGTVGVGVAAGGVEYIDEPAMVLMLAPLPTETFRLFSGVQPLSRALKDFEAFTVMVHAVGSTPDLQSLLAELSERTTTGYLFGGLSSARNQPLHIADGAFAGGLSGVAFGPEVQLLSRVTQGCQPIGPLRAITRGERNYVAMLDGEPALDCVLRDLGAPPEVSDDDLLQLLASTLVGLVASPEDVPRQPGQFGPDTVVRHLVGVGRETGVLAIAEHIEPGMRLAFCTRNPEAARRDLLRIVEEIRDECGAARRISGALYVSCSGRGGPHFGAPNAEFRLVQQSLGDVPVAGFFAGGEIARHHLYGYTGVLTAFTEPA